MIDLLQIPIFLYQAMYILFSSVIPILIILWLVKVLVKALKNLAHTAVR